VLRVGQRYVRDDRTLTHLCLVSRALGAEAIYLQDVEKDIVGTVNDVNASWGGDFRVVIEPSWKKVIGDARADGRKVVHLTMYGLPLSEKLNELRDTQKLLIVVGGPKVPGRVYHDADYNVSVTSQPHSEIAALAITLHEIQNGEELKRDFGQSKLRIVPTQKGKHVVRN
jgi:tRNA (cytidine56-2'-O)-methyltransferase